MTEPTRITEDTENILDLFFCNNLTLVNRVETIPGIFDHECVYVESSLRPSKTVTPPRKVHLYHKADLESLKGELRRVKEEFISMEPTSTTQELWVKFCSTVSDLMIKYIPSKMLKGNKVKKPWINRTVRSLIRRRNKLFRKMKKKQRKRVTYRIIKIARVLYRRLKDNHIGPILTTSSRQMTLKRITHTNRRGSGIT